MKTFFVVVGLLFFSCVTIFESKQELDSELIGKWETSNYVYNFKENGEYTGKGYYGDTKGEWYTFYSVIYFTAKKDYSAQYEVINDTQMSLHLNGESILFYKY